jgi:hypothetical protein
MSGIYRAKLAAKRAIAQYEFIPLGTKTENLRYSKPMIKFVGTFGGHFFVKPGCFNHQHTNLT